MAKSKKPFVVPFQTSVQVMAFDEESARAKVERALAESRKVAPDVVATGELWTYAPERLERDADNTQIIRRVTTRAFRGR